MVGYLLNSGGFDSHNTIIEYKLPKGLTPVGGSVSLNIGLLSAGDTYQFPLSIKIDPHLKSGPRSIGFSVTSDSLDPNEMAHTIHLLAPPKLTTQFIVPDDQKSRYHRYQDIYLKVMNDTGYRIPGITVSLLPNKHFWNQDCINLINQVCNPFS